MAQGVEGPPQASTSLPFNAMTTSPATIVILVGVRVGVVIAGAELELGVVSPEPTVVCEEVSGGSATSPAVPAEYATVYPGALVHPARDHASREHHRKGVSVY